MTKTQARLEELARLYAKADDLNADLDDLIEKLEEQKRARLKNSGIAQRISKLRSKIRKQVLISERTFEGGGCKAVFSIRRKADLNRLEADGLTGYLQFKPSVAIRRY